MPESVSVQSFLSKTDRSLTERLVAVILLPFAFVYRLVMAVRRLLYLVGLYRSVRLPLKVISVGGITVGGSGKTPTVIHLIRHLQAIGKRPLVLTRGYGGESEATAVVKPGDNNTASRTSDEVRLMSEKTGAMIGVGADRVAAFHKASESTEYDVAILDDGFQHLRIIRDLDIVTIDATAPLGNGYMLPAGNLREPKASIRRADAIVFTRFSQRTDSKHELIELQRDFGDKIVVSADYAPSGISNVQTDEIIDSDFLRGEPHFAFSAIANPWSFFSMLASEGFAIGGERAFRDHHIFTQSDMDGLIGEARSAGCTALIATEKDEVKLKSLDCSRIPVYAFRIRLEILAGENSLVSAIARVLDDKT
jgi:tetraacyldisaccharide 4'-kinase